MKSKQRRTVAHAEPGPIWEPTHLALKTGGQALCGAPMVHPFNVTTEPLLVECERCKKKREVTS